MLRFLTVLKHDQKRARDTLSRRCDNGVTMSLHSNVESLIQRVIGSQLARQWRSVTTCRVFSDPPLWRRRSDFWWTVFWSISFPLSDLVLHTLLSCCSLYRSLRFLNGFPSKQSVLLWSWYFVLSHFCARIVSGKSSECAYLDPNRTMGQGNNKKRLSFAFHLKTTLLFHSHH